MEKDGILKQINALYIMRIKELKEQYRTLYPGDKSLPSNKDFLIRRIAYKLQENVYGGLSTKAQEQIETLKTELNPLERLNKRPTEGDHPKTVHRLPLPGSIITKTYKGRNVEVKVLHKGFEYKGKPYRSLTQIAREITGVHQSGFVFFGV